MEFAKLAGSTGQKLRTHLIETKGFAAEAAAGAKRPNGKAPSGRRKKEDPNTLSEDLCEWVGGDSVARGRRVLGHRDPSPALDAPAAQRVQGMSVGALRFARHAHNFAVVRTRLRAFDSVHEVEGADKWRRCDHTESATQRRLATHFLPRQRWSRATLSGTPRMLAF